MKNAEELKEMVRDAVRAEILAKTTKPKEEKKPA